MCVGRAGDGPTPRTRQLVGAVSSGARIAGATGTSTGVRIPPTTRPIHNLVFVRWHGFHHTPLDGVGTASGRGRTDEPTNGRGCLSWARAVNQPSSQPIKQPTKNALHPFTKPVAVQMSPAASFTGKDVKEFIYCRVRRVISN